MSRWFVLCLYCDSWSCETDDLEDGAMKGEEHAQECRGKSGPRPWPDVA